MGAEINVFYRTSTQGKAHIKVSGETFKEAGKEYVEAVSFAKESGWVEDSPFGAAQRAFGTPTGDGNSAGAAPAKQAELVCVEDGSTITGETVQGTHYSAQKLADGRAKKIAELGVTPPGPRCQDCWKRGGYASRYKALKGYSS